MSLETPVPASLATPAKSQGFLFVFSLFWLLVNLICLWRTSSSVAPAAIAGVLLDAAVTGFCVFQFGSRTFQPARAAARTARLTGPVKDRLRQAKNVISVVGALAILAIEAASIFSGHRTSGDWYLYFYPPVFLLPGALADLIGDPPRPARAAGSFGRRPNWSEIKPIRSDHWGERA